MNQIPENQASDTKKTTRRNRLLLVGAVVVVAAIAWGAHWWMVARHFVETDNAYVSANSVQITSEIAGTVLAVDVDNTQHVDRGQALVSLDPADARIAMASAEAELARTVRSVRGLFAQSGGLEAMIDSREVQLRSAQQDLARREKVAKLGGVSGEELQHARNEVAQLQAALATSREDLAQVQARIEDTEIATHPEVLAASAKVRDAALALERTRIVAPVTGTIAQRQVEIGTRIAPGQPLLTVVPLDEVWVDANFKEVQLENVRVGQPVTLEADIYGGDVEYHGHVVGLSAGTGSAFALLPAQNASGNWIKIVQRVPVRIAIDREDLQAHPLRVGLSMDVSIDITDTSGSLVATQVRQSPQPTLAGDAGGDEVERHIAQIIARNAGQSASTSAAAVAGVSRGAP